MNSNKYKKRYNVDENVELYRHLIVCSRGKESGLLTLRR